MKATVKQKYWVYVLALSFLTTANADTYNITFHLSDFDVVQVGDVVNINPKNIDYMFEDDVNKPAIPFMPYKQQVNGTFVENSFNVQVEEMTLLFSNVNIAPNMPSFSDSLINTSGTATYVDGIYPFPTPMTYHFCNSEGKGTNELFFSISPFVYDTRSKALYFINSLCYTYETVPLIGSTESNEGREKLDYLIVTSSELKEAFVPLKEWKTKKGVKTDIIIVEDIYENYTQGSTNQEKIKYCLLDYYQNKGIKWVLLGGDVDIVPSQMCYIEYGGEVSSVASDMYYTAFSGTFNWNADNDNSYGEVEDDISLRSNIYLSRLPISNSEQITAYVQKLLLYEKSPPVDGWLDKMLFMGHKLFSSEKNEPYRSDVHYKGELIFSDFIQPNAPNILKKHLYDTGNNLDYEGKMTRQNMINAINEEQPHILFMQTHGHDAIWMASNGYFTDVDASNLNNVNKPMVIVTSACLSNNFASNSLSEAFVKNEKGGAIAYWGSSNYGWVHQQYYSLGPSTKMCAYFLKYLFTGESHFSEIIHRVKELYVPNATGYNTSNRWLLLSMNAVGDCEMPIYTKTPEIIDDADIHITPMSIQVMTDSIAYIAVTSTYDNGNTIYQATNTTSCSYSASVPVSICLTRKDCVPLLIEGRGIYTDLDGYTSLALQDVSFPSSSTTYHSDMTYVGENDGNKVVVEEKGKLVINSNMRTVVHGGLTCKKGGKLIIK